MAWLPVGLVTACAAAVLGRFVLPAVMARLRCGRAFGIDPTVGRRGRLVRCDLPLWHRGRCRQPKGTVVPVLHPSGYRGPLAISVRCPDGHAHADRSDAATCALGGWRPGIYTLAVTREGRLIDRWGRPARPPRRGSTAAPSSARSASCSATSWCR